MQLTNITAAEPSAGRAAGSEEQRAVAAARDFEALLLGQLLKAAREATQALFPEDEQAAGSETYLNIAEDEVARTLAAQDLLGITKWIQRNMSEVRPESPLGD